jgi:hypothetical protein
MSATITTTRGYTFGATELVTNTKLHTLIDSATSTISGIVGAELASGASIVYTQLAQIGAASMVCGSAFWGLATIPSGAGYIPPANLGSGTPSDSNYLRGDSSWQSVSSIPTGVICMWSGTVATIPSGWYLCNGSNGTPDLRGRFVIAAQADSGSTYDVGDTGNGTIPEHTHGTTSFSIGNESAHTHNVIDVDVSSPNGTTSWDNLTVSTNKAVQNTIATSSGSAHTHTLSGTIDNYGTGTTNIAIYYALAFIMKG